MWWQWLIFALLIPLFPFALSYSAVWIKRKNNLNEEQNKILSLNIARYTLFYWLCDLFYMSFIINSLTCKYVFGGLIMIIIFYNIASIFVSQSATRSNLFVKFGIIQDFVVGVGLSVFLIYSISNEVLQEIVIAVVAALYGGLFTLVGVAWTIRKGDTDRKSDLERIELERKENERKLHIPYLKAVIGVQANEFVNCYIKQPLNFDDAEAVMQLKDNTFYAISIDNFVVKNVSDHNVILRGIIIDDCYYKFDNQQLLESNSLCQIQTTRNWNPAFAKPLKQLLICVDDLLGNSYTVACELNPNIGGLSMVVTSANGQEYSGYGYKYQISNLSLPTLKEE